MNFKEIYKAPFKLDHYVQDIAYTVDEERAFDFGAISLGDRELILDLLNGKTSLFKITAKIRYNDEAVQVFNEDTKLWDKTLLMVRGWGNLTGVGGLNMSEKEASRVQDAFGNWIIKKLT